MKKKWFVSFSAQFGTGVSVGGLGLPGIFQLIRFEAAWARNIDLRISPTSFYLLHHEIVIAHF